MHHCDFQGVFFGISICTHLDFVTCMTEKIFPRLHEKQILQLFITVIIHLKIHSEIIFLYLLDAYLPVASGYARYCASSELRSMTMFWIFFWEMKISLSAVVIMVKNYAQVCFEAEMATMAQFFSDVLLWPINLCKFSWLTAVEKGRCKKKQILIIPPSIESYLSLNLL